MNENRKSRFIPYFLGALQVFIGLTAIRGGLGLVTDPSGTKSNIPLEWLNYSPFTDYFFLGLLLLIVIGVGYVLAAMVAFFRNRYSGNVAVLLGLFLISYMIIEVWFIGLRTFLQPLYFVLGVIVVILGLKLSKFAKIARRIRVEPTMTKLPT
jgi:hypothetical protein